HLLSALGIASRSSDVVERGLTHARRYGWWAFLRRASRYIWLRHSFKRTSGIGVSRRPDSRPLEKKAAARPRKILFVIGTLEGESKRYRVFNYRDYLSSQGFGSDATYEIEVPGRLQWML